MQKRAKSARAGGPRNLWIRGRLVALFLASGVAAVDLIDARFVRCRVEAMALANVTTSQIGPKGTSAVNSPGRMGWAS